MERHFDPGALIVGAIFVLLGVVFLTGALDITNWRYEVILPVAVIGAGVAAIAGALWRADRYP